MTRFYHASGNRPAKLIVAGADETFELTIYPPNGVEQPWDEQTRLPILDNLPANPVGTSIQAIAEPRGEYNNVAQFKPSQITVVMPATNGSTPPRPSPADPKAPPRSASTPPLDQNQMRIMRQSTLHYASILMAPIVKDFATPQLVVERTIQVAGKFLEYVISGENPFEPEEESEEAADDFGSL